MTADIFSVGSLVNILYSRPPLSRLLMSGGIILLSFMCCLLVGGKEKKEKQTRPNEKTKEHIKDPVGLFSTLRPTITLSEQHRISFPKGFLREKRYALFQGVWVLEKRK